MIRQTSIEKIIARILHDASGGWPVTGDQIVGTAHARYIGNISIGNAYCQERFISCCYAGWMRAGKQRGAWGREQEFPPLSTPLFLHFSSRSLTSRCTPLSERLEQAKPRVKQSNQQSTKDL